MDRPRALARVLSLAAAAFACAAAAGPASPPLQQMRWLAPGTDLVRALGHEPSECLRTPADPAEARAVEVGRAAFRTPLLLGGQAGMAGLSCASCHRNGRTNPDFLFPGLSGAPGTADVTSSLLSSHRGDGIANPRPIPDLGGPKTRLKVSQDRTDQALERFVHGLVTEEFDGPEPSPAVLRGLAAYVRALSPEACAGAGPQPVTADTEFDDVGRAGAAAVHALEAGDRATAALMLASARSALGRVHERYGDPSLEPVRRELLRFDRDLAGARAAVLRGDPDARAQVVRRLAGLESVRRDVAAGEPRSLFNPTRLAGLRPAGIGDSTGR